MQVTRPLPTRASRFEALAESPPDVLVVGGGITGAGIALDLALRGVRVALVERDDWASATSSASSRLIHGGLRYLEHGELGLVRESCLERGLLLRNAAGWVWPETFTFPVHRGAAVGRLKLVAGLVLYTLVSIPRVLGLPRILSRRAVEARVPGIASEGLRGGGAYLDGATDDARLTLATVATAIEAGAVALSRVEALGIEDGSAAAEVRLADRLRGSELSVRARAVVLAGGPFTDDLRRRAALGGRWVQPTRGTHLIVPRERLPTDGAVIFPSAVDGRVMFLIPWPRYTVVGTTDLDASPDGEVRATRGEVGYLLDSANALAPDAGLTEDDVVSTWAGLRPLLAADESSPSARSREERIERANHVYTIAGGKLTAYRSMAETLCARITEDLGIGLRGRVSPTRRQALRGALPAPAPRPAWSALGAAAAPDATLRQAWSRRYAALASEVEELCGRAPEGRRALDPETLLGEVDWAVRYEDCLGLEDFLLRRTDLGYGTRAATEAGAAVVLARLAEVCAWDRSRKEAEHATLESLLGRLHGWRDDAP